MQIGRKIYYELSSGNVIEVNGERTGDVIETTVEQDFESYQELKKRVPSTVGVIQLTFGQFAGDFATCTGYRVDITGATPTLVFSYPDPNTPEEPPVYQKPLSEEVAELKSQNSEIIFTLIMNDLM